MTNFSQQHLPLVEKVMVDFIAEYTENERLKEAMLYSIHAGGKRLRPLLVLTTVAAFQKEMETQDYQVAASLEMIHTYSLIHDDLPAMDNDDFRRGKPTNHKVFGEATAILAGDALLTYSFELISSIDDPQVTPKMKLDLVKRLAQSTGAEGMVAGQAEDLIAENEPVQTVDKLEHIHYHKTGKLIIYSIVAGAILANATTEQQKSLEQFGYHLGIAFQIQDDILDVEGDSEKIGKPVGSDHVNEKSTYPKLLTLAGAKQKLSEHLQHALNFLENANIQHDKLEQMAYYIINRDN